MTTRLRLTPEGKAKWVKALRGRKFKQGTGYLYRKDKHCCLGVLCEVNKEIAEAVYDWKSYRSFLVINEHDDEHDVGLPFSIQSKLAKMNDDGLSFKAIADYIEKSKRI